MALRLVTWNVNSVRARIDHALRLIDALRPDILCLQEIKVEDAAFPGRPFVDAGLPHIALAGQKGYHGVAVLSRLPLADTARVDWGSKGEARHVSTAVDGRLRLHNLYIPAGGDVPDAAENPKFAEKLAYFDNAAAWFADGLKNDGALPAILVGDLNVAPLPSDVWSHKQLLRVVSHTPVEVEKLEILQAAGGWCDVMRHVVPAPAPLFTWWSYRARDWRKAARGRRLDHVWVSPGLIPHIRHMAVFDEARDWPRPSDHAPVVVDFDLDL